MSKRRKIVKLNDESLYLVLKFLEPKYLELCRLVCKTWNNSIKERYDNFYKHLFHNYPYFVNENIKGSWRDAYIHRIKSKMSQTYVPHNNRKINIYLTHDNGGRPFKFVHSPGGITIYKREKSKILVDEHGYPKKIYETPVYKCDDFIGYWVGYYEFHPFMGNSILIKLTKDTFVFVGDNIYQFEIENDEMIDYVSPVGNSDIPYPVALGKKYLYFMHSYKKIKREDFKREITFRGGESIYSEFYGHIGSNKLEKIDMKNIKLIQ